MFQLPIGDCDPLLPESTRVVPAAVGLWYLPVTSQNRWWLFEAKANKQIGHAICRLRKEKKQCPHILPSEAKGAQRRDSPVCFHLLES